MAQNKTTETEFAVADFIDAFVSSQQKKADSYTLIQLLTGITGESPRMWGPSIIGFGRYEYRYASGHSGTMPLLAFSPRKAAFSLYITALDVDYADLLDQLGKHTKSKACLYVNKLADIDLDILQKICNRTLAYMAGNPALHC